MIERYYSILGVNENSTLLEIKKAFRIKSKQIHPDVNKKPNANEEFVFLIEAYEFLINLKTGKTLIDQDNLTKNYNSSQHWQDNYEERIKHRAEYYSQKKYTEFEKSEYFKKSTSAAIVFGHLAYLLLFAVFIFLPIYLLISEGLFGLLISGVIIIVTLPITRATITYKPKINLQQLISALKHLNQEIAIILISIFNIVIILKIGLNTLIPLYILVLIFLVGIILTYAISQFILKKTFYVSKIIGLCYYPFLINILLTLNYFISFNTQTETYIYRQEEAYRRNGTVPQASIILEDNKYNEYTGILIFLEYEFLISGKKIKYTFKEGLLGIRVMTNYEIIYKDDTIDF